jgi:hypothetical protein
VLPAPDDRVPGTFDQDVYVELLHRYHEAAHPADGTVTFTLHAFLRAMGRRVDGRTYEQLRGALTRLERTVLESSGTYFAANKTSERDDHSVAGRYIDERMTLLTAVSIDRRRSSDRDQLGLFPSLASSEPGEARVTLSPLIRANIEAGHTTILSTTRYFELPSPTARRLYRLIAAELIDGGRVPERGFAVDPADSSDRERSEEERSVPEPEEVAAGVPGEGGPSHAVWNVALDALADQLPLSQRYPSHLQRVLEPAHAMLKAAGLVREAVIRQQRRGWVVHYELPYVGSFFERDARA